MELQAQMATALANHRNLESRLNFQEELIMDKSHGEETLDSAVESHSSRLDNFEEQLKMLEVHTPRIAAYEQQIQSLTEKASRLEDLDSNLRGLEGKMQETSDLMSDGRQKALQARESFDQRLQKVEESGMPLNNLRSTDFVIKPCRAAMLKEKVTSSRGKVMAMSTMVFKAQC